MAMKQTQTKLFDFSDVGLDFCAGSKNLFPDRFKKMLVLGYNEQTASSVAVSGNQVTFTYGGAHGYVADRVLKVDSGALASINGGEFWIDSVTTNTVTFTLDDAPTSVSSGFTTRIASLGWDLVYEQDHIHIYKFKHIDDTDMYARLCFQNTITSRNCVVVAIGRTADLTLGHITDPNCYLDTGTCATVNTAQSLRRWEFSASAISTHNNYNYNQGYSTYGLSKVVGSIYHFLIFHNMNSGTGWFKTHGIVASATLKYGAIDYPLLILTNGQSSSLNTNISSRPSELVLLGVERCFFQNNTSSTNLLPINSAGSDYLPTSIDGFNTTMAQNLPIFHGETRQILGYCINFYKLTYTSSGQPSRDYFKTPALISDIDLENIGITHHLDNYGWGAVLTMVEEVKIGN
ncbi:hypothetical protein [Acinetobacter variabilis]|uniref:hypothetical protein n=1 Tax=Acinetobacter variabilis TaxID=70346 RepID=UPI0026719D22|nr:hypothetical protein [Acinetobacter variabilis]WKT71968.1 hypothetical protein Q3F87_08845 [Acinetobacter variabilis]